MDRGLAQSAAETALTVNRVLSWLPNRIADALAYQAARGLLGCRDVTAEVGCGLLDRVWQSFGVRPVRARLVLLSARGARLVERICGETLAVTWAQTVYLSPGAVVWVADGGVEDRESLDTLAHELWHVHQFTISGGGLLWALRWLWEYCRYGLHQMPIEREARHMARRFVDEETGLQR